MQGDWGVTLPDAKCPWHLQVSLVGGQLDIMAYLECCLWHAPGGEMTALRVPFSQPWHVSGNSLSSRVTGLEGGPVRESPQLLGW